MNKARLQVSGGHAGTPAFLSRWERKFISDFRLKKNDLGARELAGLRALAVLVEDQGLVPSTHTGQHASAC